MTSSPAAGPEPVDPELLTELLQLVDLLTPYAIRIAVTLGIPRLLHEGVADAGELADRTGAHPGTLRSLLDHLSARGVLRTLGPGRYTLDGAGRLLAHPDAVATLDLTSARARMDQAWAGLWHTVRTGEAGYPAVHGQPFWDHLTSDPALAASFDDYMHRNTTWTAAAAAVPVWPATGTVVDVGGGIGLLLADVLRAHPGLRGTLVELDATTERARGHLAGEGVLDRVTIVTGSFFDELPAGGDVYVLGHVLHDWPDPQAAAILRRVADAATGASRVLLVEQVLDPAEPAPIHVEGDLLMRVLFGSQERTLAQWAELAADAGLRLTDVRPVDDMRSLIGLSTIPIS